GLRDVERVLHVPRRVVARDVERFEVVVVGLDLGPLDDGEAEAGEDRDDLVVDARERVERAARRSPPRQGEVEPLARALHAPLRALAVSASFANPCGSRTAISASTLRSSRIPALRSAAMNREYERPTWRHAALMRMIQRPRARRFFCLRPR